MSKFFRKHEERVREQRRTLAETVRTVREGGFPEGSIATIGTRLLPGLKLLCVGLGEMRFPPAYFASLTSAVLEGVRGDRAREAAMRSLAAADADCAWELKARFPALRGIGLGTDDLMLVACEGRQMAEEAREELSGLPRETPGMTFMDRVKARVSKPAVQALEAEIADCDPTTPSSDRAAAIMVLRAARSRCNGLYCSVDDSELARDRSIAAPNQLLAKAAALSRHYGEADVEWLRGALYSHRMDVSLPIDGEDEEELRFSWMGRS